MTADVPQLIVVVGPTASGKSDFAVQLAQRHDAEIISADSVQIYRYFDIGSGKPTTRDLERVPHHLIGALDPLEEIDAAGFCERAASAIRAIHERRRRVIVCGGTFLWVRALIWGLAEAPKADEAIRDEHRQIAEQEGRPALHVRLKDLDPKSYEKLNPNDFVRVSRALEVYELTGQPISAIQASHGFREARYPFRLIGLTHSGAELRCRIEARTRAMLDAGWLNEVRELNRRGYAEARAMQSVGYRQVHAALNAQSSPDMEELTQAIVTATWVFSRRQRTWLRDQPVEWLTPQDTARFEL